MSAASCLLSEDQFLCSMCLNVFTDPVSTPCGHNFCKTCITQHWNISQRCQCPMCNGVFETRPELHINIFISEMVAQFRCEAQQETSSSSSSSKKLFKAELKRVQQYAVDVTLDPDTANPALILSDDGKQVHCGHKKNLPDNPERFSRFFCVLGNQSFSSGRFYFEVQVKGKTIWILGAARESVNRKEVITPSPENGYWIVIFNKNICVAFDDPPVRLSLQSRPEKVGVFVDYEEGLVSFYDVDDAALIYSFTGCSFTEKLHPFLGPSDDDDGKNSAPLIICPVNQSV